MPTSAQRSAQRGPQNTVALYRKLLPEASSGCVPAQDEAGAAFLMMRPAGSFPPTDAPTTTLYPMACPVIFHRLTGHISYVRLWLPENQHKHWLLAGFDMANVDISC